MKHLLLSAIMIVATMATTVAQVIKRPNSYNYTRGVEAIQKVEDTLVSIIECEFANIYYPHFAYIDHLCDSMPDFADDDEVIFVCSAAFTGELLNEFKHSNIAGNHVSGGIKYRGYSCKHNTGLFSSYKGRWKFSMGNYASELDSAEIHQGMAFGQNMIIYEHKVQNIAFKGSNIYRALCEINGRLCIIESRKVEPYKLFVQNLNSVNVKNALYLDMGNGWNYAWLRPTTNNIEELHKRTHSYTTNWIVFYK